MFGSNVALDPNVKVIGPMEFETKQENVKKVITEKSIHVVNKPRSLVDRFSVTFLLYWPYGECFIPINTVQ